MPEDIEDVIAFLGHPRPDVRKSAVGIIESLTGGPDGLTLLCKNHNKLLPGLLGLLEDRPDVRDSALKALINLSQDTAIARSLVTLSAVERCLDYLRNAGSGQAQHLVMLLANLTVEEAGIERLLQAGQAERAGLNISLLLRRFLDSGPGRPLSLEPDPYEHVAAVLTNVTQLAGGRRLLLDPGQCTLGALAAQLAAHSGVRRRGCAAALRNCCLRAEEDDTLSVVIAEPNVAAGMLEPLCGTAGSKDPDAAVRTALAEALLALAVTPEGRKLLWSVDAPEKLRKGYELEEDHAVCTAMEDIAEYLTLK